MKRHRGTSTFVVPYRNSTCNPPMPTVDPNATHCSSKWDTSSKLDCESSSGDVIAHLHLNDDQKQGMRGQYCHFCVPRLRYFWFFEREKEEKNAVPQTNCYCPSSRVGIDGDPSSYYCGRWIWKNQDTMCTCRSRHSKLSNSTRKNLVYQVGCHFELIKVSFLFNS